MSNNFYDWLLRLYPASFYREYAPLMRDAFEDILADRQAFSAWIIVLRDFPVSLVREYLNSWRETGALHWISPGVRSGLLLGGMALIYNIINNLTNPSLELINNLSLISLITMILGCGSAGFLGTQKLRRPTQGLYAGLLTSLISVGITIITLFAITFLFMDVIRNNTHIIADCGQSSLNFERCTFEDALGGSLILLVLSPIIGGISGIAGGLIRVKGFSYDSKRLKF